MREDIEMNVGGGGQELRAGELISCIWKGHMDESKWPEVL